MKGKQLAILLLLVGVSGGGWLLLQNKTQGPGTESAGGKVLDFPLNEVARVTLKSPESELHLVKKSDLWTVQERADYPADFARLSDFLRKLWEMKTVQVVKTGASQLPRLELVEPAAGAAHAGSVARLEDKDGKLLAALLLGKTYVRQSGAELGPEGGFPAGRYVMPLGSASKVSLVAEAFEAFDTQPAPWLNHEFVKIENPKAVSLQGPAMDWKLSRDTATAEWKLDGAKPEEALDSAKVSSFGSLLAGGTFADVLPADASAAAFQAPVIATVETFDGFLYTLKIGKLSGENYPLTVTVAATLPTAREPAKDEKPEDKARLDAQFEASSKRLRDKEAAEKKFAQRAYLLPKFTLEPLLKERTALLVEKKPEKPDVPAPAPAVPSVAPAPAVAAPETPVAP